MKTSIQLHAIHIDIDDDGLLVERGGITYSVRWAPSHAQLDEPPECTCIRDFPYAACRVHPDGPPR